MRRAQSAGDPPPPALGQLVFDEPRKRRCQRCRLAAQGLDPIEALGHPVQAETAQLRGQRVR